MFAEAGHPEFVGGATVSEHEAQAAIEQGWLVVVEIAERGVVGFALLARPDTELQLHQLSVHPDVGRQGIGTELLQYCVDAARLRGEPSLVLNTQADVAWNMPWYQRFGFEVVAETEWTASMRDIARMQKAEGLLWATRVHMRLIL